MRFGLRLSAALVVASSVLAASGCKTAPGEPVPQTPPVESGPWPDVFCGTYDHAWIMLDEIETMAHVAFLTGDLSPPLYKAIVTRVSKCKLNYLPTTLPLWKHCQKTKAANTAAWNGNWELCKSELDHGH